MDINQPRKSYPGMWQNPRDLGCCIYRVPKCIRDVNPEAYTPQLVLIGPLHHSLKSQALKSLYLGDDITNTKSIGYLNMEEHKKIYLVGFAQRVQGENTIDSLRRIIEFSEEEIRESYSESTAWIPSQEFVEMILHDSVFIIELMLRHAQCDRDWTRDPLMVDLGLQHTIFYDLILLENQLPYFVLEKLFDPIVQRIFENQKTLRELIISHYDFEGKIGNNSEFRHLTDLYRCVHVGTFTRGTYIKQGKSIIYMYNADKLNSGGVKFKAVGKEFSLNVRFKNGCLEMSCLTVANEDEMKLRNIMALEQCHYPHDARLCDYVLFLDYLIDSEKDVDLLVETGIIKNWIGNPALVAQMVNKLTLGIHLFKMDSYYFDIAVAVNAYYSNPVKGSQAILKRVYFSNLWTGTATIAATCLLVMTFIQTVASIIQAS